MTPIYGACATTPSTATARSACATVINTTTGELLTEHTLDPTHTYQPKNG